MKELLTRTHSFDSGYCIEMKNPHRLFIRVSNSSVRELEKVFGNPTEISEISFRGKSFHGFTRISTIRDEGAHIFVALQ